MNKVSTFCIFPSWAGNKMCHFEVVLFYSGQSVVSATSFHPHWSVRSQGPEGDLLPDGLAFAHVFANTGNVADAPLSGASNRSAVGTNLLFLV